MESEREHAEGICRPAWRVGRARGLRALRPGQNQMSWMSVFTERIDVFCARRGGWRFYNTTSKRRRDLRPLAVDTALTGNVLSVFHLGNVTTAPGFWSFSNV